MTPITPKWVHDAVFYQIFPDRFAHSGRVAKPAFLEQWDSKPTARGFKGGDLLGVAERLDYLKDLGVNAIYFTPIFQSTANHRYHTHDYFRVDPVLGGDEAFAGLLKRAHKRGMRVVIDGVFNHASRGFYQFNHALENGAESPYRDWFHFHGFPVHAYQGKPNYDCWWGIPDLPKFNTATPAVREFVFRVAEHWVNLGADGWRLDVPAEINDDSFWQEFRARVKRANSEAYIVGEIWHEAQRWLQGDQFDGVMNYLFTRACLGFFARDVRDGSLVEGTGLQAQALDARGFAAAIHHVLGLYHQNITHAQLNVLDSHDTARFLQFARGDASALKLATLFQMTYPGAPSIYYGDEVGMLGGKDPDCRRSFVWDESTWNHELLAWFKACTALRHKHPALRTGTLRFIHAEDDVVAFARTLKDETLIVLLNAGLHDAEVDLSLGPLGTPDGAHAREVFGGSARRSVTGGALHDIKVPARSGVVFKLG